MSDVLVDKQEALLKRLKACGELDVYGDVKVKVPCDDMATYRIEDCQTCSEKEKCEGGEK